jgi:hypothetical protein
MTSSQEARQAFEEEQRRRVLDDIHQAQEEERQRRIHEDQQKDYEEAVAQHQRRLATADAQEAERQRLMLEHEERMRLVRAEKAAWDARQSQ